MKGTTKIEDEEGLDSVQSIDLMKEENPKRGYEKTAEKSLNLSPSAIIALHNGMRYLMIEGLLFFLIC